uniref:ShKT domain-containing protein n=1 Tax=Pristionchus pacificus TaxID=54126 RepID=A0A8R1UHJ2_PRIPA
MIRTILLLLLSSFPSVFSEVVEGLTCSVIDFQKICFLDSCPVEEGVCIRQNGGKYCCKFENLILPSLPDPTTSTEAATTTEACEDLSPKCVLSVHLCFLPDYDKIMNVYCQKTCMRTCGQFTMVPTVPTCRDITPDCAGKESLCKMNEYVSIMKQYCARSCAFCT